MDESTKKESADFEVPFTCRQCGAEELLAEIVIDEHSSEGSSVGFAPMGPYGEQGYGCSWHAVEPVICYECSCVYSLEWLHDTLDAEVCEREAEPPEPPDEY